MGASSSGAHRPYRGGSIVFLRRWMNSSGQDSSPIHSGPLLCLVGKTIGDTRRTRVGRQKLTCDEGTLRGTYQFVDQGVDAEGNSFGGAGYEYFDGDGNIYGVLSHRDIEDRPAREVTYTAEYTVEANCTGTSTYPDFGGAQFDLFIDPGGDRFTWVGVRPRRDTVVSGVEQRVTLQRIGGRQAPMP